MKLELKWKAIIIGVVMALSFYLVYPTIRWATYSSAERETLRDMWKSEELYEGQGGLGRELKHWFDGHEDKTLKLGLDLQGGVYLKYRVDTSKFETAEEKERAVEVVLTKIRNRVDQFGTTEPIIQKEGIDNIVVELPGLKDPEVAKRVIGQVAQLTFHTVETPKKSAEVLKSIDDKLDGRLFKIVLIGNRSEGTDIWYSERDHPTVQLLLDEIKNKNLLPEGYMLAYSDLEQSPERGKFRYLLLLESRVDLSGDTLVDSRAELDHRGMGGFVVTQKFNAEGAKLFADLTKKLSPRPGEPKRQIAIVLDGVVKSFPFINYPITGGSAQIEGRFSLEEANALSIVLRSGALPASLIPLQDHTITAYLGAESVKRGVAAGVLGLSLVIFFMIFYYHLSGVIAVIAVVLNIPIVLAALAYFNATLTLPGIAGLILTVGMAVDANVLINERMREEREKGKTVRAAIDTGYDRAFLTIIDSHVTTFITAIALFIFGSGPVKGFAVTLSVGILASLFTAVLVTRAVFDYLSKKGALKRITMLKLLSRPNVPFIRNKNKAFALSAIFIVLGMAFFAYRGKDNFGIDFIPGASLTVGFNQPVTTTEVRNALAQVGLGDAIVQAIEGQNTVMIRTVLPKGTEGEAAEEGAGTMAVQVEQALKAGLPGKEFQELGRDVIGPSVGQQLRGQAVKAVLYSFVGILIYVALRFQWDFSVGSLIALFHDVLVTVGALALARYELSLSILAALLTLVGYSVMDTVVVYDRIREDMKLIRGKPFWEVVNMAMNETLSRTVLTSTCTMLTVIALFIFGGPVLKGFSFTLLVGIIVGTYSSIFVASPLVVVWRQRKQKLAVKAENNKPKRVATAK